MSWQKDDYEADVRFQLGVATKRTNVPKRLAKDADPITALYCLYNNSEPSTSYQEQIKQAMQKEPHVVYFG